MRIRSTKPEFWRSERISSVDWDARLVLKGLESYVDDNGVGKDDLALIVADVFPRDLSRNPTGTLQKVSEAISNLSGVGLLWRYEVDGTNLLYIAFWESVQRIEKPSAGRLRRPDGTMGYRESTIGASIPEYSRNPPVGLRPGTGEQGNRGTEEQGIELPCSNKSSERESDPYLFIEFWEQYPRKVGKERARKSWARAVKRTNPDNIVKGAGRLARDPNLPEQQFIPHPTTWLDRDGWDDEPLPNPASGRRLSPVRRTSDDRMSDALDLARRIAADENNQLAIGK